MGKFKSRKLFLTVVGMLSLMGLPLLYKYFGVSDSLGMIVLGSLAGLISTYHLANVKDVKEQGLQVKSDYEL
jgi:hypothetical protein